MNRLLLSVVGLVAAALLSAGCEGENTISLDNKCSFTFSYQDHLTSQLFVAAQNPGCYVFVSTKGDGKKVPRHVYVQSNEEGAQLEDNLITTAPENNLLYMLGANNEIGLIIGCTIFSGLTAFDRTCSNCEVQRAMQWTGNRQQVVCNYCARTYDLETGAVVAGAQGRPLSRYNCAFNGTALRAWN